MRVAWCDRILSVLVEKEAIDRNWAARLRKRYPKGFMLNGFIQDHQGDRNLMKRMASYIAKLPISEKRILSFDEEKEKVLIRYKGPVKNRSKLPGQQMDPVLRDLRQRRPRQAQEDEAPGRPPR